LRRVVDGLGPRFPEAAARIEEAAEVVLAHLHFPKAHRARLHSTNPLITRASLRTLLRASASQQAERRHAGLRDARAAEIRVKALLALQRLRGGLTQRRGVAQTPHPGLFTTPNAGLVTRHRGTLASARRAMGTPRLLGPK